MLKNRYQWHILQPLFTHFKIKFLLTLDFTILISQLQPTIQIWRKGWKRTTERKIWIFWQIWWLKSCELFCRSLCWFPCWGSWCTWISSLEFRNMIQRSTVKGAEQFISYHFKIVLFKTLKENLTILNTFRRSRSAFGVFESEKLKSSTLLLHKTMISVIAR